MRRRIEQVIWVLDHRRDLEADFRAFYHLDHYSMYRLDGPQFLSLATRTTAFQGVMAARAMAAKEAHHDRTRHLDKYGERTERDGTAAVLTNDARVSPFVEYATSR